MKALLTLAVLVAATPSFANDWIGVIDGTLRGLRVVRDGSNAPLRTGPHTGYQSYQGYERSTIILPNGDIATCADIGGNTVCSTNK